MRIFNLMTSPGLGEQFDILHEPEFANGQAGIVVKANAINGNLLLKDHFKTIHSQGTQIDIGLVYNAQSSTPWRFNHGKKMEMHGNYQTPGSEVHVQANTGAKIRYCYDAKRNCYVSQGEQGGNSTMTLKDGLWHCYHPETGITEEYNHENHLQTVRQADGNYYHYHYSKEGKLKQIKSVSGQTIDIEYNAKAVKVSCNENGQKKLLMSYLLDDKGRLIQTSIPLNEKDTYQVKYAYHGESKLLKSVSQSDGTSFSLAFTADANIPKIRQICDGEERDHTFEYAKTSTLVRDPFGVKTTYEKTADGQLAFCMDSKGEGKRYKYNAQGKIEDIRFSDNTKKQFSYDEMGFCSAITDRNNGVTSFKHQRNQGALLNKTQYIDGVECITFYVYNQKRQLTHEISPEGSVTAYQYDELGNRISKKEYLEAKFDVQRLRHEDFLLSDRLVAWEKNVLLKEKVSLTEWSHNQRGQVVREIRFTHVDANGRGVKDEFAFCSEYDWDIHGNCTEKKWQSDDGIAKEEASFDGLSRKIRFQNALQQLSTYEYKENKQSTLAHATGVTTSASHDRAGKIQKAIQQTANHLRETEIKHNKAGKPCVIISPGGQREYISYDDKDREKYHVDAEGYLTEYCYDLNGNRIHTIQYLEKITVNEAKIIANSFHPAKGKIKRIESQLYDAENQLRYQVDGENYVTEHRYDAAGNKVSEIAYAERLPFEKIKISGREMLNGRLPLLTSDKDRHHRFFYNKSHQLIGEQLASGHLTSYDLDTCGNIVKKTRFALPSPEPIKVWNPSTIVHSKQDAVDTYVRDVQGRIEKHYDAEGYLTHYLRDAAGRIKRSERGEGDEKVVKTFKYDAQDRIIEEAQSNGMLTSTTYHASGELESEHQHDINQPEDSRFKLNKFNEFAEITEEIRAKSPLSQAKLVSVPVKPNPALAAMVENARLKKELPVKHSDLWAALEDDFVQSKSDPEQAKQIIAVLKQQGAIHQQNESCIKLYCLGLKSIIENESWKTFLGGSVVWDLHWKRNEWPGVDINIVANTMKKIHTLIKDKLKLKPALANESWHGVLHKIQTMVDHAVKQQSSWRGESTKEFYRELLAMFDVKEKLSIAAVREEDKPNKDEQVFPEAKHTYSPDGLRISSEDALGNKTFFFYDKLKRQRLSILPDGAVIENRYIDASKNPHSICKYINKLDMQKQKNLQGGYFSAELGRWLSSIADEAKDVVEVTYYDQRDLPSSKTDGEGYETKETVNAFHEVEARHQVIDKAKQAKPARIAIDEFEYDKLGRLTKSIRDAKGEACESTIDYLDANGMEVHTDANGNQSKIIRDKLNRITGQIDAAGNESDTEWDAQSRIKKEVNALGQETTYAYQNDGKKTLVSSPEGISVSEKNVFNEVISEEHQNDANSLTVKREYDHAGRIKSTTDARGKTVFERNKEGWVTDIIHPDKTVTHFSHDELGRVCTKIEDYYGIRRRTEYKRDALGRIEGQRDGNGIWTNYVFDRRGLTDCIVLDPTGLGLQTLTEFDGLHQPVSKTQGDLKNPDQYRLTFDNDHRGYCKATHTDPDELNLVTKTERDKQGNIIQSIDGEGRITRSIYDAKNQERFKVSPEGVVTERDYNALGQCTMEATHANKIDLSNINSNQDLLSIASLIANQSQQDNRTHYYYDGTPHQRFSVRFLHVPGQGMQGIVKEHRHDQLGNEIQCIEYSERLISENYLGLSTETIAAKMAEIAKPSQDRQSKKWFEKGALERFSLDHQGYLLEKRFDTMGREIEKIAYASVQTELDQVVTCSDIVSKIKKDNINDRCERFYYDHLGREIFHVSAAGLVSQKEYDDNNNCKQLIVYRDGMDTSLTYDAMHVALTALVPKKGVDNITKTEYDANNKIRAKVDALGAREEFKRNALGNVFEYKDANQYTWEYHYDRAKRLVEEISPEMDIVSTQLGEDGKLHAKKIRTAVITKTEYDKANNTKAITHGKGLEDARSIQIAINSAGKVTGTTVSKARVDQPNQAADLKKLPVDNQTLNTKIIYNAHQQIIAECNEAGNWSYKTYDSLGRLSYEVDKAGAVTHYEYNQFDEITKQTRYAKALEVDLNSVAEKGISAELIEKQLAQDDPNNRVTSFKHENGEIEITQNKVFYYVNEKDHGEASPVTKRRYNAFGDCVYAARLISPGNWEEKRSWYDREGRLLAELDPERYLTIYERYADGKEWKRHEYAERIKPGEVASLSFAQLKEMVILNEDKDRHYTYEYDAVGNCTAEIMKNVIVQKLVIDVNNKPQLENVKVKELKTVHEYDAKGNEICTTYSDGTRSFTHYNECGQQIAETGVLRELQLEDGKVILASPLTTFERNAFGEIEKICRHKEPQLDSSKLLIPEKQNPEDQIDLIQHDSRGLIQTTQDAEGNIKQMTHTKTKQVARVIQEKTELKNITENAGKDNESHTIIAEKHLDEEKFTYSKVDRKISSIISRDQVMDKTSTHYQETHFRHNSFGEVDGVGEDGNSYPAYTDYNPTGATSVTNTGDGVPTLSLRDLRGQETLSLQTPDKTIDLRAFSASPDSLLTMAPNVIERREIKRDKRGAAIDYFAAFWSEFNHNKLPTRQFAYDRWQNRVKEINSKGHVTELEYNFANQETKRTLPSTVTRDSADHNVYAQATILHGHDRMGRLIGVQDGNKHVTGYLLDQAGQKIAILLADNSIEEKQIFDIFGNPIGIIDAASKIWEYKHNRLNLIDRMKKPSGKTMSYTHDEAGNRNSECNDALKAMTIQNHDSRNNIFETYLPRGQVTHTHSDRNSLPLHIVENDASSQNWDRDFFGHEKTYTDLSGQEEISEYDAKFQLNGKRSTNAKHGSMLMMHRDIQYYDFDKQCQFPMAHNYFYFVEAPKKDVAYSWKYGLRYAIHDFALNKLSLYEFSSDGLPEVLKVNLLPPDISMRRGMGSAPMPVPENGVMILSIRVVRDRIGRICSVSNHHMNAANCYSILVQTTVYDLADFVYSQTLSLNAAGYSESCRQKPLSVTHYQKHDETGRLQIAYGEKTSHGVDIVNNKGLRLKHEGGRRTGETFISEGVSYDAKIGYTDDGELRSTAIENRFSTSRILNEGGQLSEYVERFITREKDDSHHDYTSENLATTLPIFDINGWQKSNTFTFERSLFRTHVDPRKKVVTSFTNHPSFGFPIRQSIRTDLKDNSNHDYAIEETFEVRAMTGFGSWRPVSVFGKRSMKGETGDGISDEFIDPNGVINAKKNSADEQYDLHKIPEDKRPKLPFYFDTIPEGWVISKTHIEELESYSTDAHIVPREVETHYFGWDIEGNVFAGYWDQPHNYFQAQDALHHLRHGGQHTTPRLSALAAPSYIRRVAPVYQLPKDGKCRPLQWNDPLAPTLASSVYITQPGDTFESIARHDLRYAHQIERENAWLHQQPLRAGQMLRLPEYIPQSFKANYSRPYHELLGVMMGSIMPFIKMPAPKKPKINYVKILIEVIAAAVVIYLSAGAASSLASSMVANGIISAGAAQTATTIVATGVIAGLGDSAVQFTNMKLGIRDHYSFKQSVSMAIAGAAQAGAAQVVGQMGLTGNTAAEMMAAGSAAVASQFAEMAVGIRTRFDIGAVAQQVAAVMIAKKVDSLATSKLGKAGKPTFASAAVSQTAQTATNSLLGSAIHHTPIDIKLMAAQSIGNVATHAVTDKLTRQTPEGIPSQRRGGTQSSPSHAASASRTSHPHPRSRPLSAQDRQFIAETEAVTHMKLDEPGLDLEDKNLTDIRRQTAAYRDAQIHDSTDQVMGVLGAAMKGTLAGGVIDSARQFRQDGYTVAYGSRDQQITALEHLGVDIAVPVAFGLAGSAARVIAPTVSRLGMWGRKAEQLLNPYDVRFSQQSVSFLKMRGSHNTYTLDEITQSMAKQGWQGKPIDVVNMPEGGYTSLDNTRVLAARRSKIDVVANVHKYNERLPSEMAQRFEHPMVQGAYAETWGEALEYRLFRQSPNFQNRNFPIGTYHEPSVTFPNKY